MVHRVLHKGSCHCGTVKWQVYADEEISVIECNCSVCKKKHSRYFIVPLDHFCITAGHEHLLTYSFNTHTAKHNFCRTCGVQSFFIPRTNPDAVGIMPHCIDSLTVKKEKVIKFDGMNFDSAAKKHRSMLMKLARKESCVNLKLSNIH
ncbi:unnamed protein product [Notodromas monacha]|uniref:CENP-V/GFA domain-containing protein n=1 Tax=Notodromas monacha TaxID=399045 RepID=A0A7R9BN33_9CRUS|nr:unnamed protein product [Notodromas monacha]CAG0917459.1 unnamed protein product [Notodromas monacha]